MNNSDLYLETKFLSYIQGIEGMYARYYAKKKGKEIIDSLIDEKLFKTIKDNLYNTLENDLTLKAIEEDEVAKRLFDRLKLNIKNSNTFALREKINRIICEYPDEFLNQIFGESEKREEFIRKVVRTRDVLSHGGNRSDKNYDRKGLLAHFERLKFILEMCLLKMIELPLEKRIEIMSATRRNLRLD